MKTMKFKGFKAEMILSGTKTSSIRLFDDKGFKAGDEIEFIDKDLGKTFAFGRIDKVTEKPLNEINQEDLVGHEPFKDFNDMYEKLKRYYPSIMPSTPAKVVHFIISKK
jgi:hypothetical protein